MDNGKIYYFVGCPDKSQRPRIAAHLRAAEAAFKEAFPEARIFVAFKPGRGASLKTNCDVDAVENIAKDLVWKYMPWNY